MVQFLKKLNIGMNVSQISYLFLGVTRFSQEFSTLHGKSSNIQGWFFNVRSARSTARAYEHVSNFSRKFVIKANVGKDAIVSY